jgi:hypothetical protein
MSFPVLVPVYLYEEGLQRSFAFVCRRIEADLNELGEECRRLQCYRLCCAVERPIFEKCVNDILCARRQIERFNHGGTRVIGREHALRVVYYRHCVDLLKALALWLEGKWLHGIIGATIISPVKLYLILTAVKNCVTNLEFALDRYQTSL